MGSVTQWLLVGSGVCVFLYMAAAARMDGRRRRRR